MGWRYEVHAWLQDESGWAYQTVHQGQSFWKALNAARKAKRTSGCVKIEWR